MSIKKILAGGAVALLALGGLAACSEADIANQNNRAAADNFELNRRIVFFNGFTDNYLLVIEGRCSVNDETGKEGGAQQLEVTCKVGDDQTKKHMLGLSDNTSYFVEQLDPNESSGYHYRVILRPETIAPDVDLDTSAGEVG